MPPKPLIWITKTFNSDGQLQDTWPEAAHFMHVPLFCVTHLSLKPQNQHYDAAIITSAHAAFALKVLHLDPKTAIFCVGPATEAAVLASGFNRTFVASHDGESLVDTIHARLPQQATLIYLRGRDVSHDLKGMLFDHGYECIEQIVYQADLRPFESLQADLLGKEPHQVWLYSKRACEAYGAYLNEIFKKGDTYHLPEKFCVISNNVGHRLREILTHLSHSYRPQIGALKGVTILVALAKNPKAMLATLDGAFRLLHDT